MADQTITPVAMSLNAFTDAVQAGASLTTSNDGLCLLPKDGKHVIKRIWIQLYESHRLRVVK